MFEHTLETIDPMAWLISLEQSEAAYERLVEQSGSLARAAHRVASARCGRAAPTASQVASVARELAVRIGYFDIPPSRTALSAACAALT
jgi:hypothetical protein